MTRTAPISRFFVPAAALLALAYLGAMVVAGSEPVRRQLVTAEAGGLLTLEPSSITGVTLSGRAGRVAFSRTDRGAWVDAASGAVPGAVADHLETAIKMMHRSPPVREIHPEEATAPTLRSFGLEAPRVLATLSGPGGIVLTAHFGALNPEGNLQYMRVDGDRHLYLVSRFIGAEWIAAVRASNDA